MEAIDRSEKRLGFAGQPRIVSFHINEATGEKHLHAAWFRVDFESERAIDPGMFKNHLKQMARKLEREFVLRELSNDRPREHRARAADRNEFEQSRRLGTDIDAVRTAILDCYEQSDSGKAFKAALESRGVELATGDRRDCFVVIDAAGGHHALNKKLTGQTLAATREKLADLDRSQLPSADQAQALQAERQHAREAAQQEARAGAERPLPAMAHMVERLNEQPEIGARPQIAQTRNENFEQPERPAEEARKMERERQFGAAAFDATAPDARLREAWRQPEFSKATIEADPWTAVYLEIPKNAEPWLLLHAQGIAHECEGMISRGPGAGPLLQQGNDGPNENLERAGRRALDLEERLQEYLGQEMPRPTRPEISETLAQAVTEPFGLGERVTLRAAEQIGDRLGKGIEALADSIAPEPPMTKEQAELAARAAQEATEARERAAPQQQWDAERGQEIDEAVRQQQNELIERYSRYGVIEPVEQPKERGQDFGREIERDRD
jgi:hypothetical protein